ncbi:MAG: hypothetical protein NDJ94_16575 [Vicinamibacteria bacterium]|nr:hypothetical protein [Vicinamibacteria bacterium]
MGAYTLAVAGDVVTPVTVHCRLNFAGQSETPVRLVGPAQVEDAASGGWLGAGLLVVSGQRLEDAGTVACFEVSLASGLPFAWYLQRPSSCALKVSVQPDVAPALPGLFVPLPSMMPAITGPCTIALQGLDPTLEVEVVALQEQGLEGVLARARVVVPSIVAATDTDLGPVRQSIQFSVEGSGIEKGARSEEGDWVTQRFAPISGAEAAVATGAAKVMTVTATVGSVPLQWTGHFSFAAAEGHLQVQCEKPALRLDGSDSTPFYAYVVPKNPNAWTPEQVRAIAAGLTAEIGADAQGWVVLSAPACGEDSAGWNLGSQGLDQLPKGATPPGSVSVTIKGQFGTQPVSERLSISLGGTPELVADKVRVTVLRGGPAAVVTASVNNRGDVAWSLDAHWLDDTDREPPDPPSRTDKGDGSAEFALTAPADARLSGRERDRTLVVTATGSGASLEKEIVVALVSEGLALSSEGRDLDDRYPLPADAKSTKTIRFAVWAWDAESGELRNDLELVEGLTFDDVSEDETKLNAASTAKPSQKFTGKSSVGDFSKWEFTTAHEIPGNGEEIVLDYEAAVPGRSEPGFTVPFKLMLVATKDGPDSPDWTRELHYCEDTIRKFVPIDYQQKCWDVLEKHKLMLDADGLRELRKRFWKMAYNLVLGDESIREGYLREAAWADRIVSLLDWLDWLAETIVRAYLKVYGGPHGELAYRVGKLSIVSLLRYVDALGGYLGIPEGNDPSEWFWTDTVPQAIRLVGWETLKIPLGKPDGGPMKWFVELLWFVYQIAIRMAVEKKPFRKALEGALWEVARKAYIEKHQWFHSGLKTYCPSFVF